MTLLEDVAALDVSAIAGAKLEVKATLDGGELSAVLDAEVSVGGSVLGEFGTTIGAALRMLDDPSSMVDPLVQAIENLLARLAPELPIAEYVQAVADAARIVADILAMISGDPHRITLGDGPDIGEALERVGAQFGDHAMVVSGGVARLRRLIQSVERGLPENPDALLGPALEIILPFPTGAADPTRAWALGVTGQIKRVTIDPRLTEGLVEALVRVRVAANAGEVEAIRDALGDLQRVRDATIGQLAAAMRSAASVISGLRIAEGASHLAQLRGVLATADDTVLEMLEDWRRMIASVRETVPGIDPAVAMSELNRFLDEAEKAAAGVLLSGIDGSVAIAKQWIRDLLREVPIRPLRMRISDGIAAVTAAVREADLDAPVDRMRAVLADLSAALDQADPTALIRDAVTRLEAVLREAIDAITASLGTIGSAIDAVADTARDLLTQAVDGLREFKVVTDEITAAIGDLGIDEATAEIVATLGGLREKVSELLTDAPIPEALRSSVDQLVSTLESLDLEAAIAAPLRELTGKLQIPEEFAQDITRGLEKIAETVENLIPETVVEDLTGMMDGLLRRIQELDVSSITDGVGTFLDDAATTLERVRIAELMAPAGTVFGEVVHAVDLIHPRVVLRPAIDLYDQVRKGVQLPSPDAITRRAADVISQAGEAAARTAAEPARRLVDPAATTPPAGTSAAASAEEPPEDLRPGDIVRLIGFLPARLRESLAGLGTGEAGRLLAAIDDSLTGTATTLRSLRDGLFTLDAAMAGALDAALAPITAVQVDAQLALQASAGVGPGGLELDASLMAVASVSAASIEDDLGGERALLTERCRQARAGLTGAVADDLDAVAGLLDAVLPTGLLADVDAFLAALDPEPIAAELDALMAAVVGAMPAFLTAAGDELRVLASRIRGMVETFSPGTLMQRYLDVLDVVADELELLDPGRLADELGEVHAQVRAAIAAYDPVALAGELDGIVAQLAARLRTIDVDQLMPDLSGIAAQAARIEQIVPARALEGVGEQLREVGGELRQLDVAGMLKAINTLAPEITENLERLIAAVRAEIVALLKSIRFATVSVTVTVEVR